MFQRPLLLAALPALVLGACAGTPNRTLESVHQPLVARTDYLLDLDAPGGALAPGEADRLDGWFGAMRLGYGDQVAVDDGPVRADHARGAVAAVVARYGMLLSDMMPVTPAPVTPGTVRVIVSRSSAAVPNCPDWSRNLTNDFEGHTHSNFGCAVNANLAAMVASPADLVRGRTGDTAIDPAAASKAIDTYRKAQPTGNGKLEAQRTGAKQ